MGFNVEFRDTEGSVIDWAQLDKEVCELWGIASNPNGGRHRREKILTTIGMSFSGELSC